MQPDRNTIDKTRVFIVHGRNEALRKSMFDFLRSIGLKPIEWSQAIQMTGNASPFIGDVLDAAFQQAQAVVVLLNGDDEARLRPEYHSDKMPDYEKELTPQARPNVIFEAGLALGRFPKRTIIIEVGDLRPFSDIAGRHTIRMNNSTQARQDLAQRLSLAGCDVDLSGTDWHQSGNFDVKQSVLSEVPTQYNLENQPPSKPPLEKVADDMQTQILTFLSTYPRDAKGPTFEELHKKFPMHREKFIFLFRKVLKTSLITVTDGSESFIGDPTFDNYLKFKLTGAGWSYLIENNLL